VTVDPITRERLFGAEHAFDHPVVMYITIGLAIVLAVVPAVIWVLRKRQRVDDHLHEELTKRYLSWLVLVPLMVGPVLLGAFWTILAVLVLSLLCYREYARATGLFRERLVSALVVLGIAAVNFASLDNWYHLFAALMPLVIVLLAAVPVFADQPQGYIQRVALGVFGFMLFGSALGHLGFLANDANYRPMLLLILLTVELNDVFGYVVGKPLGHRKLCPNTSPKKTVAGALGALVLTTTLVAVLGHYVFKDTALDQVHWLIFLGLLISVAGQLGDLVLSSIKRDIGIKDMGVTIPGHGGLLDRFDSLLLVAPAVFHFVKYVVDIGAGQPQRIFTGGM
jgi:phosphatidate cytidylyltransferase